MTELFPDIAVFYDDDPVIPALTFSHKAKLDSKQKKADTSNKQNVPATIEDFVRPQMQLSSTIEQAKKKKNKYAWLICCSTVFLIDIEAEIVWASPDESILPLVSIFITNSDLECASSILTTAGSHAAASSSQKKIDMSTMKCLIGNSTCPICISQKSCIKATWTAPPGVTLPLA